MSPEMGAAIVAAYSELGHVGKDREGHYGSYATLTNVLDTVKPVLARHGLAMIQYPGECEAGFVRIVTMLVHDTGETFTDEGLRMPAPNDPQKVGSTLSYCRRYSALTVMGLGTADDDDGQAASDAIRKENEPHPNSDRVKDVVAALKALDATEKEAVKQWAEGHSLAPKALLDDDKWLDRVETFLTEMTAP
jgi:hypothetical protein